eukprot:1476380-Amphidinium_carterae.1
MERCIRGSDFDLSCIVAPYLKLSPRAGVRQTVWLRPTLHMSEKQQGGYHQNPFRHSSPQPRLLTCATIKRLGTRWQHVAKISLKRPKRQVTTCV